MSTGDLPKVHVRIEKSPCEDCQCNVQAEDRKLKHWRTWMDIRKETHKKIIAQTGRESGDMLMNSTEDIHEKTENQLIIQYTNITNNPDKYRGCPKFFDLPVSLFEKYWKRSPTYFSVITKEDQCIVPEMQYIRTSDIIRNEKGISSKTMKSKVTYLKSKYLQERRKYLQRNLLEIEPHKPIGDFTIIGSAILKKIDTKDAQILDDCSTIPSDSVLNNCVSSPLERIYPLIKINGETIYNKSEGLKIININIEFDVSSRDVHLDYFTITNYTSKALRFYWTKIKIYNHFEDYDMLYVVKQQGFFFNLNEFVVIPQQTKHVPMYFKSKSEGLYNELWTLTVAPDLWRNNLNLQVKLNCVAVIKSFELRSAIIKQNLQNRVRERIIDESLRKILATVPEKKAEYVVYSYDKATLFEAVNSSFSPINLRPKYIYNKLIVAELDAFYEAVRFDHHPAVWNLNLNTLRQYTKEREMHNKELQLQEEYKLLLEKIAKAQVIRRTREDLLQKLLIESNASAKISQSKASAKTPKVINKKSNDTKSSSVNKKGKNSISSVEKHELISVPLIKRHDIPITLSQQLEDIIIKLQQPITWANEQQQKLIIAYALFCAHFDNIQADVANLNINFNTDMRTNYPLLAEFTPPLPLRMISEYHDDTMIQAEKFREPCGTVSDKQAEPWVHEIPLEDYQTRYRAFHCIVEDPKLVKSTTKGKKNAKKESPKDKNKPATSKSAKSSPKVKEDAQHPHLTVVIQYDPYAEVVLKPPKIKTASIIITQTSASPNINYPPLAKLKPTDAQLYKNNLYTIFYINLQRAVDDLEALLLLQSKISVKHNIIQKVTGGFTIQTINQPETIKIVDLRRVISESLITKETPSGETPTRPCYNPLILADTHPQINTVTSDSSLWDILQKPKLPTKQLEPGEYTIMKDSRRIETQDTSTSVTHLEAGYSILAYQDEDVQVDSWQLARNTDCHLYCDCEEEKLRETCELAASKVMLKVKMASDGLYPQLMIDGTRNFKFYADSDEEELVAGKAHASIDAQAPMVAQVEHAPTAVEVEVANVGSVKTRDDESIKNFGFNI